MRVDTLFALSVLTLAPPARAQQCGSIVSQCRRCHEVRGARPVLAGPLPWHVDHAFADICARCHGGDPLATDEAAAHVGVGSPLTDVAGRCAPCHPSDAAVRARRYVSFVPLARATPPLAPAATAARPGIVWGNVALAAIALALALGGVLFVYWNERRLGARGDTRS